MTADDLTSPERLRPALAAEAYAPPPPVSLLPSITATIAEACRFVPEGHSGALIGQADESGLKAVLVQRIGDDFRVVGWVGKEWRASDLSAGVAVQATW